MAYSGCSGRRRVSGSSLTHQSPELGHDPRYPRPDTAVLDTLTLCRTFYPQKAQRHNCRVERQRSTVRSVRTVTLPGVRVRGALARAPCRRDGRSQLPSGCPAVPAGRAVLQPRSAARKRLLTE